MQTDPYLELARTLCLPYVWLIFAGILLVVFLFGCADFYRLGVIKNRIKEATALLPIIEGYGSSEKKQKELRTRFFENFESFKGPLSDNNCLGVAWTEFTESMISDNDGKVFFITQRPADYFHRESVTPKNLNLLQLYAYPNYLTGLGLFFTFVGIAAALQVAQNGLTGADGGHNAMQELLRVASTKFLSSLFGIIFSLIFAYLLKWQMKEYQHAIDDFCHRIEAGTEHKPISYFLYRSHIEAVAQTEALTDMAKHISEGVTNALANQLPASVHAALEPLVGEIRGLAAKFSGSNEDALQSVLEQFLSQMRSTTGKDMDHLVSSIGNLKESLEALIGNMKTLGENFGSETKASTARLGESMENFVSTFAPVEQGMTKFGETLSSLETMAARIESAGGNFSGAAETNNESVNKLAEKMVEISKQITPLHQVLETSRESLSKMSDTASQLETAANKIFSAAGDFQQSASAIGTAETLFSSKVQSFAEVASGISATVQTLGDASSRVNDATEPLGSVAKEVVNLLSQIQESEKRLLENQTQMNSLLLQLQKYSEVLPSLYEQYESRFENVDSNLASAFGVLANGSEKFQASISGYVRDIDEKFAQSLSKLSGVIHEFTEEREMTMSAPENR